MDIKRNDEKEGENIQNSFSLHIEFESFKIITLHEKANPETEIKWIIEWLKKEYDIRREFILQIKFDKKRLNINKKLSDYDISIKNNPILKIVYLNDNDDEKIVPDTFSEIVNKYYEVKTLIVNNNSLRIIVKDHELKDTYINTFSLDQLNQMGFGNKPINQILNAINNINKNCKNFVKFQFEYEYGIEYKQKMLYIIGYNMFDTIEYQFPLKLIDSDRPTIKYYINKIRTDENYKSKKTEFNIDFFKEKYNEELRNISSNNVRKCAHERCTRNAPDNHPNNLQYLCPEHEGEIREGLYNKFSQHMKDTQNIKIPTAVKEESKNLCKHKDYNENINDNRKSYFLFLAAIISNLLGNHGKDDKIRKLCDKLIKLLRTAIFTSIGSILLLYVSYVCAILTLHFCKAVIKFASKLVKSMGVVIGPALIIVGVLTVIALLALNKKVRKGAKIGAVAGGITIGFLTGGPIGALVGSLYGAFTGGLIGKLFDDDDDDK